MPRSPKSLTTAWDLLDYSGSLDNSNAERPPGICTTKFVSRSRPSRVDEALNASSVERCIVNSPDPLQLPPTAAKKKPVRRVPGNLGRDRLLGAQNPIGKRRGSSLKVESWNAFRRPFELYLILPSDELMQTIRFLSRWNDMSKSFGVVLVRENLVLLGKKQPLVLTLKIPDQNSGMVTEIRKMLFWMNFGEVSMCHTYSGGSIATQSVWKSKDLPDPLMQKEFGSLPISNLVVGTLS